MRSLVEFSGDGRICRKRKRCAVNSTRKEKSRSVDRKLDLVVRELRRYGVSIAGIQESKWFGCDVWPASRYTFLHSGRPLPSDGETATRNECVGIALDEEAALAWKSAGEVWEAVSSRLVTAWLQWSSRKEGGGKDKVFVSVLCAYAPTARATPGVKQKFYAELQDTINKVPANDILVLLGDFNAWVGVLAHNDLWSGVLGRYGLSERNIAGEELLEFCASIVLSIMNTWLQKREIHQGTLSHPATKKVHMIDFIMMSADQRVLCRDVRVMRGADCWSDHMLVRAKLNGVVKRYGKSKDKIPKPLHFISLMLNLSGIICESLAEWLKSKPHVDDGMAEENWEALKACVVGAAEESLGRAGKKQPEWFEANFGEFDTPH